MTKLEHDDAFSSFPWKRNAVYHKHTFIYLRLIYSIATERSFSGAIHNGWLCVQSSVVTNQSTGREERKNTHTHTKRRWILFRHFPCVLLYAWSDEIELPRASNHAAHIYNPTPLPSQTQHSRLYQYDRRPNVCTRICMYTCFDSVAWRIFIFPVVISCAQHKHYIYFNKKDVDGSIFRFSLDFPPKEAFRRCFFCFVFTCLSIGFNVQVFVLGIFRVFFLSV